MPPVFGILQLMLVNRYYHYITISVITSQGQKKMEEIIKRRIRYEKPSGRLQRLVALIKEIKTTGENFIIVSDRLFLLSMAYYVLLFFFLTADCIGM